MELINGAQSQIDEWIKKGSLDISPSIEASIIGETIEGVERFDAIEIQSRETGHGENPYSVHVHLVEGGIECLCDFIEHENAVAYADRLGVKHERPVYDFAKPVAPKP
jgi:hypothetical protein